MTRTMSAVLLLLVLVGAYQGVRALIRAHVDDRIQASHGRRMPAFELPEVTNTGEPSPHIVASSAFLGRVLVLNFMRSHCVNCEREKADVRAFAEHLDAREAAILSIMTDQVEGFPPTDSAATLSRSGFTHPVLMADQPFIDALHGSTWSHVTPITYFVDRQGTVVESLRGAQTEETLQAALQRTLEAN